MPRVNRVEIFADDEIQVFHLVNRCVRRTYLCGRDEETGRDYSHRKQWIRDRLEVLAGIFAVDVLSFAVMRKASKKSIKGVRNICLGFLPDVLGSELVVGLGDAWLIPN